MFKNIIVITLIAVSSSWATSIDDIVKKVVQNNQDLKSLQKAIEISSEQIKISDNWKNPVISLGRNDIRMDEPNKRDLEPMQADFIGFSQIIPIGNKLEIQEDIAKSDTQIAKYSLENRTLELKSKVYEYAYNILILEEKYKFLTKYQNNVKKLEQLSNALYENGKMKQSDVMNIKIAHSKVELKKISLQNLINNLYLKLEELTFSETKNISASLFPEKIMFHANIKNHPKVLMTEELSKRFNSVSKYEIANKNSDLKLNVAYFSRDSKYEDYANISVSMPLSVYGTENIKATKAKLKSQEILNKKENLEQKFKTTVEQLQNNMNNAVTSYILLKETIIPLQEEIQKNIESYNSFNQVKPQETIKSLNEVISYEMMLLDEVKKYFTSYSKILYFTQGKI